ncbi:MAG: hypothetical protein V4465_03195 [Patescibacteria group bacterium]
MVDPINLLTDALAVFLCYSIVRDKNIGAVTMIGLYISFLLLSAAGTFGHC